MPVSVTSIGIRSHHATDKRQTIRASKPNPSIVYMNWTILKTIEWLTNYLQGKDVPEARLNAEHLIAHSLKIGRMDLYLQFDRPLTKNELAELKPLIERRAKREPLQYILETQPFRKVDIKVRPGVLIPRPETEIVVEEIIQLIPADIPKSILELGVGSGAIVAAIAGERDNVQITATEISPEALAIAKENTAPYNERITLLLGDLFEPIGDQSFDLIVSNPPYMRDDEWSTLQPEVRDHEPLTALKAGKDGLDFYRRIINDSGKHLNPGGFLIMEMGDGQSESIQKIINESPHLKDVVITKDLTGKDRVIRALMRGDSHG